MSASRRTLTLPRNCWASGENVLDVMVRSEPVRRSQIWKLRQQIGVGAEPIRRHSSIREDGKEMIEDVIGKGPAVVRV